MIIIENSFQNIALYKAFLLKAFYFVLLVFSALLLLFLVGKAVHSSQSLEDKMLILVSQNKAHGQIVVADVPDHIGINFGGWHLDQTKTTLYAAEFLQRYIKRITGVTMPIVGESAASPDLPLICVGRSSLTGFIEQDRRKLSPEGFIIRRQGRIVAIAGEVAPSTDLIEYRGADRGTLFGVFEFLERVCGVRWYFPHEIGVVIPILSVIEINNIDLTMYPYFPMRTGAVYYSETTGEFADVLPVTRYGNTTGFYTNHTHDQWWKYIEKYPEIFAVGADGERNIFKNGPGGPRFNHIDYSNPSVLEIELRQIKEFDEQHIRHYPLSREPSEKYVSFMPKDNENINHCQCDLCKAQWTTENDNSKLSNLIFGYSAKLALEIKKKYPGRRLATGAYAGYLFPPTKVSIPDNMDVMICTVKGNSKLVSPAHWKYNTDLVNQWLERLGNNPARVFVFEYLGYPSCSAPTLYPAIMKRWLQFLKGKSSGGFCNGINPKKDLMRYRFSLLNGWLWHKLLWNPDADVDAILNNFYKDLFGPAEKPMRELFTLVINCWENAPWENKVNRGACSFVTDMFLYDKVYPHKVIKEMQQLLRKAREVSPKNTLYSKRVDYFGKAFDMFFNKAAALSQKRIPLILDSLLSD